MTKKPESRLQKSIQVALRKTYGGWWFKVWGGPFTKGGIPDLVGTVGGVFIALEVKRPVKSSKASALQIDTIEAIRKEGGGYAAVVRSKEEAICAVLHAITKARRSPRVRLDSSGGRLVVRAESGEDLYYPGVDPEAYRSWIKACKSGDSGLVE